MTASPNRSTDPRSFGGQPVELNSLPQEIFYAWRHMRRSTQRVLASRPTELFLLWILLLSTLGFLLAWFIRGVLVPAPEGMRLIALDLPTLFLAVMVRVAGLYLIATVLAAVCRLLGGLGTWRETRIAVFWAALVTAPINVGLALVVLVLHLVANRFPALRFPIVTNALYWIGLLLFVWFLAVALSRAHRFRSAAPSFLYLSLATLLGVILLLTYRVQARF